MRQCAVAATFDIDTILCTRFEIEHGHDVDFRFQVRWSSQNQFSDQTKTTILQTINMSPSNLSRAITQEQWKQVVGLCRAFPEMARMWTKREGLFDGKTNAHVLPLHEALVGGAPLKVIRELIHAYPNALSKQESSYKRLPLHIACRKHADTEIIEYLLERHHAAALEPDSLDRLPIHYALTNGAEPEVIDIFMKHEPACARGRDYKGWNPVFVALNVGASEEVVKKLLDANPESTLMRTKRGFSIRSVIPKDSTLREELLELVTEEKLKVEEAVHLPSMKRNPLRASRMVMV